MLKKLYNFINSLNFKLNNFNLEPISREFGFNRGTPIDRIYIEDFLNSNTNFIKGNICEIADNSYSKKFAKRELVKKFEVMHYTNDNKLATLIGDLTKKETLKEGTVDCFILTQTLNFIYDVKAAIEGLYYILAPNGTALVTVAGICQISRYDMDRWGDYWRFTDLSIKKLFSEVFGESNVEVYAYGNVASAIAFLKGLSAEDLTHEELFYNDPDYQVTIVVRAKKL